MDSGIEHALNQYDMTSTHSTDTPAFPTCRYLILQLGDKNTYRSPLYSQNEILAGPDFETESDEEGFKYIQTPGGRFDLSDILKQLPESQKPDVILVKADATNRIFPQNLTSADCAKVLVLGNTQHLTQPIQTLVEYAKKERFDYYLTDHKAHHLHFFVEAGLKHVHWIPGLNYNLITRELNPKPRIPVSFIGQVGDFHPYRKWLITQLAKNKCPIYVNRHDRQTTIDYYADSQITLNISLNGDLNLRVFEVMGAGGFLMTDQLSAESGLYQLFEEDKHFVTYSGYEDLREKIDYYLGHPDEIFRIRKAGQQQIFNNHAPHQKAWQLHDLIFKDKVEPTFQLDFDDRCQGSVPPNLDLRIALYEYFQDIHLNNTKVEVYYPAECPHVIRDIRDLPRLTFHALRSEEKIPKSEAPPILLLDGQQLDNKWLKDQPWYSVVVHGENAVHSQKSIIEAAGFKQLNTHSFAFMREPKEGSLNAVPMFFEKVDFEPTLDSKRYFRKGRKVYEAGDFDLANRCWIQAIQFDRSNQQAYEALSKLYQENNELASHEVIRHELARLRGETSKLEDDESDYAQTIRLLNAYEPILPQKKKILVITNLFPPQEMGGFGKTMWELCLGLINRNHDVVILTSDSSYLHKEPAEGSPSIEQHVHRNLALHGNWKKGILEYETDDKKINEIIIKNHLVIRNQVEEFQPEVCIVGNIDLMGYPFIREILDKQIPVIHRLGNQIPGYPASDTPKNPNYCMATASQWLQKSLLDDGYPIQNFEVLYPGAPLEQYYRLIPPDFSTLRIAFAGIVAPFKGLHTLINALVRLKQFGIPFECHVLGNTSHQTYFEKIIRFCTEESILNNTHFYGFQSRKAAARIFDRCNILAFPTSIPETFGKSQIEAMASGMVVISTAMGGAAEVIQNGETGLVIEKENDRQLANKLRHLVDHPDEFAQLSARGQQHALQFTDHASVDKLEEIIAKMTTNPLSRS